MDYNKLQKLSVAFTKELNLVKNNLPKARQSEALKDLDFLNVVEKISNELEEEFKMGMGDLFSDNQKDYKFIYDSAILFLQHNTKLLKEFNDFFNQAKKRGDLKEQILKLLKENKWLFKDPQIIKPLKEYLKLSGIII